MTIFSKRVTAHTKHKDSAVKILIGDTLKTLGAAAILFSSATLFTSGVTATANVHESDRYRFMSINRVNYQVSDLQGRALYVMEPATKEMMSLMELKVIESHLKAVHLDKTMSADTLNHSISDLKHIVEFVNERPDLITPEVYNAINDKIEQSITVSYHIANDKDDMSKAGYVAGAISVALVFAPPVGVVAGSVFLVSSLGAAYLGGQLENESRFTSENLMVEAKAMHDDFKQYEVDNFESSVVF